MVAWCLHLGAIVLVVFRGLRFGVAQGLALVISLTVALTTLEAARSRGWLSRLEPTTIEFAPVASGGDSGTVIDLTQRDPAASASDSGSGAASPPRAAGQGSPKRPRGRVEMRAWMTEGGTVPHPVIGWVNRPHAVIRSYYPSDPRGEFETLHFLEVASRPDPRGFWLLALDGPARGTLQVSEGPEPVFRVEIETPGLENWQLRLRHERVPVVGERHYRLRFRGRADQPRTLDVRLLRTQEPFELGLNQTIELGTDWKDFEVPFLTTQDEPSAILQFDGGADVSAFELAGMDLYELVPSEATQADALGRRLTGISERWALETAEPAAARLVPLADRPAGFAVEITNPGREGWQVAVSRDHLPIERGQSYLVTFRARAKQPRKIGLGVSRRQEPYQLGVYRQVDVGTEWSKQQVEFIPQLADEPAARLHFDLGAGGSVEIDEPRLLVGHEGPPPPELAGRVPVSHVVTYRTNGQGLRGPEIARERDPQTLRVVCLGDSFTFGVGVSQGKSFPDLLGPLLTDRLPAGGPWRHVEVLNCGSSGYSTREERLFFEEVAEAFDPQVVLVMMVSNDDLSYRDEVALGYIKLEPNAGGGAPFSVVQNVFSRPPARNFDRCVEELRLLETRCRAGGRHLAASIFRYYPTNPQWNLLVETVTSGMAGTGVPVWDLGHVLLAEHRPDDLMVHEVDGHPNPLAHRLAAEHLAEQIEAAGWLGPADVAGR